MLYDHASVITAVTYRIIRSGRRPVGYASSAAIIWQAALTGATPAEIAGWDDRPRYTWA